MWGKKKPEEKKVEVCIVLSLPQFEKLKEQCRATTHFNTDPAQLAYNMGMLRVLELLKEGFVVER